MAINYNSCPAEAGPYEANGNLVSSLMVTEGTSSKVAFDNDLGLSLEKGPSRSRHYTDTLRAYNFSVQDAMQAGHELRLPPS